MLLNSSIIHHPFATHRNLYWALATRTHKGGYLLLPTDLHDTSLDINNFIPILRYTALTQRFIHEPPRIYDICDITNDTGTPSLHDRLLRHFHEVSRQGGEELFGLRGGGRQGDS